MLQYHRLNNGIRVLLEPISHVRSVSIGVYVANGSRDEPIELSGVSHMLEHMYFKGTTRHNARELAEVLDSLGGHVNAYTTKEYTCYHAKVLDEHAKRLLDTLSEMLFESEFAADELEREKRVVLEEIKMYEDNSEEAVHDLILETAFEHDMLGANILGTEESLERLDRTTLKNFAASAYTPDRMVISVCGHFDALEMLQWIEESFAHAQGMAQASHSERPPQYTPKRVFQRKSIEQVHVCVAYEGIHYDHKDAQALVVLNNILGASSSSRLFQDIREERGLAYNVFSYHSAFRDTGLYVLSYGTAQDQATEVLARMDHLIASLLQDGVTESEMQKSKDQLRGSLLLSLESTSSRMSRIAKNELLLHRTIEVEQAIDEMMSVTREDIARTAQHIFSGARAIAAVGAPSLEPIFEADNLR
ncbi:M16 family metallopeptidase [Ferroacidibacillus organovorans]|uniref:Zinc protease n=1 Tax=Ferroacidibacillus organovorans TaxID=1765683 RepID=A0A853KDQ7_9BACL|nr:pitrilysin family protein [Ferroacidibacillus organovorans]KYP82192.1 hypothetical protein AYJ22_00650 [Ferroacidibacillus organovorans]OAG94478.1 hypothetical protein AYW79_05550 [Ferroacidibacillus organovorans]